MKKYISFSVVLILFLNSCGNKVSKTNYPVRKPNPVSTNTGSSTTSAAQVEREYQALMKTYKSETAEVLTYLLNDSSNDPKTSITVENKSRCNMVLTISGTNYFKKVPIGANKIGAVMVPKNQNYNLSGMICNAVYHNTKFVSSSYEVKLSN
ncbi:hypothetical protein SAMN05421856_101739 [Chryseobacterium taichungense]|uniref:DUF6759 domain-containing protein n=1 Tax=Chryseobacterium taichungense TaxID=295069 RepID=A0A1H7WHI1_9FLAO|nr:DUF6759 domain-containing protein [Chryseobacterium taichungense]SEM20794.1 hypothetical protein SAMN05421856_101739 [Chryseobacterium taichungense]